MASAGLRAGLRRLAGASAIYGLGSVFMRGLSFLLLPVYTRYLAPADYGLVALCTTAIAVLNVVLPLGLHGAVSRSFYATDDPAERRQRAGTLWAGMLLMGIVLAVVLDRAGPRLAPLMVPGVPYHPLLRLALWTACFNLFTLVPLVLLQLEERAGAYVAATVGGSLLTTCLVVYFVVVRRLGAYGYLLGGLVGAALLVLPYVLLALRSVTPVIRRPFLVAGLVYSLPLVPHSLASWVLELSDRAVLARWVPLSQVGVYSLGYQLGAALGLLITAFTSAWVPFLFKAIAAGGPDTDRQLARLVTYYMQALIFCALGWALVVEQVIGWVAPPAFGGAARVTPWIVAGYVLNGLYVVPVGFLFWKERTRAVALTSLVAAGANLGLNLILVPRYGMIAAAWSTLTAYAIMLALAWMQSRRVYAFPYEYRRLGVMVALGLTLLLAGLLPSYPEPFELSVRIALWLAYPVGLLVLGVFDRHEVGAVRVALRRLRQARI
jgi:O-antigen/teichoic acid export membrane protein